MLSSKQIISWLAVIPIMLLLSCKDDDAKPSSDEFQIMTEYMVQNNLDVTTVLASGWITGAPSEEELPNFLSNYYVIDVRSATDFADGHIEGAVNTTLANVLTTAQNADKPILVACYTGQSAGHAVMALRLSGYPDAKVLKFGMSGWRSDLMNPWNGNTGNVAVGHENWSTEAVASNISYESPELSTGETLGADILAARVQFMLEKGFQGVANTEVLGNPGNYFINNYWDQGAVDLYGHIDGAFRIKPLTLAGEEYKYMDPNETVVSYCWTGQTSSMLTAYLTVLGYEAKSLKFGVNGMIFSELQDHKYAPPSVDLPVVTD